MKKLEEINIKFRRVLRISFTEKKMNTEVWRDASVTSGLFKAIREKKLNFVKYRNKPYVGKY